VASVFVRTKLFYAALLNEVANPCYYNFYFTEDNRRSMESLAEVARKAQRKVFAKYVYPLKVIPSKLFYFRTFFETSRN